MKIRKNVIILSVSFLAVALSLVFCLKRFILKPKEIAKTKVAIVIDDWGYNLRYLNLLREIDIPITISILPNLRYSSKIARFAKGLGLEVILHLPLEPEIGKRDYLGWEQNTITSKMDEEEVVDTLNNALASVPDASGVSNHMGSLATKNRQLMSIIFIELKKRNLFFLDNLVVNKSICRQLAKEKQIKYAARDVFLDNLDDVEYIKGQFKELREIALARTEAIGIGHAKLTTLKVLKDEIASMQAKGIELVFISDLIE